LFVESLPNIKFARLDMDEFLQKSEFKKVWLEKIKPAKHGSSMSNLMRVQLLFKYGGAYVDTDVFSKAAIPTDIPSFGVHGKTIRNSFKHVQYFSQIYAECQVAWSS